MIIYWQEGMEKKSKDIKGMKIRNKQDEHIITLMDNGEIWRKDKHDSRGWSQIAKMFGKVCNVYTIYGLQDYDTEKYIAVPVDILKYRRKFKVQKIRRLFQKNGTSEVGLVVKVKYGYLNRTQLSSLLRKRKIIKDRPQGVPVILIKKSDWEFRDV